jgi:hypothetical protein
VVVNGQILPFSSSAFVGGLSSVDPFVTGGAGGGGTIALGALSDSVLNGGFLSVLGGSDANHSTGEQGVIDILGMLSNTGTISGDVAQNSGFTADQYFIRGGAGGAGAGGDGQLIPDGQAGVPEPGTAMLFGLGTLLTMLSRFHRWRRG